MKTPAAPDPLLEDSFNPERQRRYNMLRLGLGCNVTCPFCNVPWESYDYPRQLTQEQVRREVDLIAGSGSDRINISGGEPTLRRDLPDIVRYARSRGIAIVELQTNGILLAETARVQALKDAGLTHAFVGLHSHIPKVHDFSVKAEGSFAPCVQAIKNLAAAGIEVTLNPVVTVASYKTLTGFMEFVKSALPGVDSVSLSVVQPHGRAWKNRVLLPRYGDISPYVERALEAADRLGLRVNNPFCGLPLCVGGWHKRLPNNVEYCESLLGKRPGDDEKTHPEACSACSLKPHCGGVWKEYPLIHPVSDLRPL